MGFFGVNSSSHCPQAEKSRKCNDCNSAPAPVKGKMKVLKKIKRRMGLASRSGSAHGGTNNLPPLLFHSVHGENIRVLRDGTVAKRVESFCKGIVFSSRPVKVNEKICVKFLETSTNWSGVLRFGFTSKDPSTQRYGLPKYACPDLTNKPGYWAKAMPERLCQQGAVLHFHVSAAGEVHFGVDGEDRGVFFGGVDTRGPLWGLLDVYGNSTAVEFVDWRCQMNNRPRGEFISPTEHLAERLTDLHLDALPALRHQPSHLQLAPLPFHRLRGRNARLSADRCLASRSSAEFCQGYVFSARPLRLGERVVVQVLSTEPMFQGCLGLGLTSCDPGSLKMEDLPDDSNFLLDRPEYWVLSRDFARNLAKGDEVSFCVAVNGEVQISRNGASPSVVVHVDQTLRLWAFFDIYGSTQKIRVLTSPNPRPASTETMNAINSQSELSRHRQSQSRLCVSPADIQVQPVVNGGAVLSVILPPTHAGLLVPQGSHHQVNGGLHHLPSPVGMPSSPVGGTMISSRSSTYIEPVSSTDSSPYSPSISWPGADHPGGLSGGMECTICYEKGIDAVLYMCGHMCMCYECALQQWRGKGGGHCPLCRAPIRDVIRTYKS